MTDSFNEAVAQCYGRSCKGQGNNRRLKCFNEAVAQCYGRCRRLLLHEPPSRASMRP